MANLAPKAALVLLLDTAAAIGQTTFTVTRPFTVLDASALCTVSAGGGTCQVKRGLNALTNAMTCATAGNLSRCASLTLAERSFVAADSLIVAIAGGAAAAQAIVSIQPTAITGAS